MRYPDWTVGLGTTHANSVPPSFLFLGSPFNMDSAQRVPSLCLSGPRSVRVNQQGSISFSRALNVV